MTNMSLALEDYCDNNLRTTKMNAKQVSPSSHNYGNNGASGNSYNFANITGRAISHLQ
jgi:hypothetical protein